MSNKNPNPSTRFQKGDKPYLLRKTHGRPKTPPIPSLAADQTFRHVFRTVIREKPDSWFEQDLDTDTKFERMLKKAGRDLTADSTPVQALFSAFNYVEPIPKSDLEGTPPETLSLEDKALLEKMNKVSTARLEKIMTLLDEAEADDS